MTSQHTSTRGFTLLELSVVLAIIAVVSASGIAFLGASLQSSQVNNTVARMNTIDQALLNFGISFNRVPCPSLLSIAAGATNYGVEAGGGMSCGTNVSGVGSGACSGTLPVTVGTCASGTTIVPAIPAASVWSNGAVEGGVPTRALKLPDSYMYDAWGHRFRYAVDPTYTASNTLPLSTAGCSVASTSALTIEDSSDSTSTPRSSAGLYVLLSHGQNGHGAYSRAGGSTMYNAGVTNSDELKNCHCTAGTSGAVTATGTSAVYVQKAPAQITAGATLTGFDDLVSYKEPWQIQAPNVPLSTNPCMFVGDYNNNHIYRYNNTGALLNTYFTGGTATGNINAIGNTIATDKSGNLWVADQGNNRVEEFTASGSFLLIIGGASSACNSTTCGCTSGCGHASGTRSGDLNAPNSVTFDSTGNVWVADQLNNRVQEYTNAGSWIKTIGGTAANCAVSSCACTSGSTCPTTSGSASGQLNQPVDVAIDPSGNIWVSDINNSRLVEYTSAGSWIKNVGGVGACSSCACSSPTTTCGTISGSGNGQFNTNAGMIVIDSGGNVWANDFYDCRMEKFSNAGSYLAQFGSCGTGNGQFNNSNNAASLYIDTYNNIWVADANNSGPLYRVQEFNTLGAWESGFTVAGAPAGLVVMR